MALHEVSAVFHLATADPFGNDRGTAAVLRAASLYHSRMPVVVTRPAIGLRVATDEPGSPVPLGIARFGEVFGPGDRRESRVVPRTIAALIRGERPRADDGPARDFVFVRDAALACLRLAEVVGAEAASRDYTFRSGRNHTSREMVEFVRAVTSGESLAPLEPPVNSLGWQPSVSLGETLHETIVSLNAKPQTAGVLRREPQRKAA
jgi:dTDP-D-glucose 4,6-dehydratase